MNNNTITHAAIPTPAPAAPAVDLPDSGNETPVVGDVFAGLVQPVAALAANDELALVIEPGDDIGPDSADAVSGNRGDANTRLRQAVGPRLVSARFRSGLGQTEAAKLLGYTSPAQLNQWELNRRLPPLTEIIKAARLYCVSVDYLVAESTDSLRDPSQGLRDACLRGVRKQLERVAEITVDQVARHARLVGPNISTVTRVVAEGDSLLDAIQTLYRLNGEALDDMRGGATLVRCAESFEAELLAARKAIRLHDALDGDLKRALTAIGAGDLDPLPGDETGETG